MLSGSDTISEENDLWDTVTQCENRTDATNPKENTIALTKLSHLIVNRLISKILWLVLVNYSHNRGINPSSERKTNRTSSIKTCKHGLNFESASRHVRENPKKEFFT